MEDYWFSGLVKKHINMYLDYFVYKQPFGKTPGLLHPILPRKQPFQIIHMDQLSSFETNANRKRYLLVVVDNLIK